MTTTASRSRQPKGVSTGGQFAAEHKAEAAGVALSAPAATPDWSTAPDFVKDPRMAKANRRLEDAQELAKFATALQENYPDAVAFDASGGPDDGSVNLLMKDGSTQYVDDEISGEWNEDLSFHGHPNKLYWETSDEKGWLTLDQITPACHQAVTDHNQALSDVIAEWMKSQNKAVVDRSDLDVALAPLQEKLEELDELLEEESNEDPDYLQRIQDERDDLNRAVDRIYLGR